MKKIDYPTNYSDIDKGINDKKTNIDTFKTYETIEFEREDPDTVKGKDWDIFINNFGNLKLDEYKKCSD